MNPDLKRELDLKFNFCTDERAVEVEAFLMLQRAAWATSDEPSRLIRAHGITPHQFNVLKILQVCGGEGVSCSGISDRMITRDSDVTRLLDKLVRDGYAKRQRSSEDRRIVLASLTEKGQELIDKMHGPLIALHHECFEVLGKSGCEQLIALLNKLCGMENDESDAGSLHNLAQSAVKAPSPRE